MCGIVGAVASIPVERQQVERMRDQLAHRGPDHAGSWISGDGRVCLGHRRLTIIDPDPAANQPFRSADGRFVITFNGEIYNFAALREELLGLGIRFRTRSDTEVLIEAYRQWGQRCLDRLVGMFAFALWDEVEHRLFCARDRVGEKPFHYAVLDGVFVFASELKALTAWPSFPRQLDFTALVDYLTFGFVPDPKTIWAACKKLPPAHWMTVRVDPAGGRVTVAEPVAYWDLVFDPDYREADWGSRIRETLTRAAREMTVADVPVGTFLSGGVDSSAVGIALAKAQVPVVAFTVGFQEHAYDERRWAREVARRCGTTHVERLVRAEDVEPVIERLIWHYDEPFNDYSYLPTYYLCREARQTITVALSGDGADELFAGYPKYRRLALREGLARVVPAPMLRALSVRAAALCPAHGALRRRIIPYGLDTTALLTDTLVTGLAMSVLRRAARGALREALCHYTPNDVVAPLLRRVPLREVGLVNAMRYLDLKLTLAGDILVKIDRASMAVSLEARPVYLHRELIDLARRIPSDRLATWRQAKHEMKRALAPWLPESVLYRKKMGFALHLREWTRGDGHSLFARASGRQSLDEWIDPEVMEDGIEARLRETGDASQLIHAMAFLRRWVARWLDERSGAPGAGVSSPSSARRA